MNTIKIGTNAKRTMLEHARRVAAERKNNPLKEEAGKSNGKAGCATLPKAAAQVAEK